MYQSGRAGDEAKKRKFPAKSGRVGITVFDKIRNFNSKTEVRRLTRHSLNMQPLLVSGVNQCNINNFR